MVALGGQRVVMQCCLSGGSGGWLVGDLMLGGMWVHLLGGG